MVRREVGCGQHDWHRGFNQPECIAPAKDFQPGLNARPTPFADENIIKFAESLDRQESAVIGKALKDGERLLLSLWTIDALCIDEDVCIQRQSQSPSS
jgi:hypothetical protein